MHPSVHNILLEIVFCEHAIMLEDVINLTEDRNKYI